MKKILCVMLFALGVDFCSAGPAGVPLEVTETTNASDGAVTRILSNKKAGVTITQTGEAAKTKILIKTLPTGQKLIDAEAFIPLEPTTVIKYNYGFSAECGDSKCTLQLPDGTVKSGTYVKDVQSSDFPDSVFKVYASDDEYMCVTPGLTYVCGEGDVSNLEEPLRMVPDKIAYDFIGVCKTKEDEDGIFLSPVANARSGCMVKLFRKIGS